MEIITSHIKRPEAILLDMGGVLQDANVTWSAESWERGVPAELGRPEPFDWFLAMSRDCLERFLALPPPRPAMDVRPVIAQWLHKAGMDASREATEKWFRYMLWWEAQPIYGFVKQPLERLRAMGFRMGVVSNSLMPGDALRLNFQNAGILEYFEAIVFSAEEGINKPDPRLFAVALERMGVTPEAAWFVGDKPQRDVLGAHRAGLTAVLVDSEHTGRVDDSPAHMPEVRIRDLAELPRVFDKLQQ